MTPAEIERIAAAGHDMPDGLTMPEITLYQSMRHLYAMFKLGKISRDKAHSEKKKILSAYADADQMQKVYEYHRMIENDLSHISQEITHSGCECCKSVQDALAGVYRRNMDEVQAETQ